MPDHDVAALLVRLREDPSLLERVQRLSDTSQPASAALLTPIDAVRVFEPLLAGQATEHFAVAALDRRCRLLAASVLTRGSDSATVVDPRQVFAWALRQGRSGAHAIMVAHNHPSGDPTPSQEDVSVTHRLAAAGRVLGIAVTDHLVLADGPHGTVWSSLRQEGVLA